MTSAKNLLEKIIKISTNTQVPKNEYETQYRDEWGLEHWNSSIFEVFLDLNAFNYYILFRFNTTINTVASSYIWDEFDAPTIGVITINQEKILEKSITKKHLKYLMLQQFIHLLGFQIDTTYFTNSIVKEDGGRYYISKEDCPNIFAYAKTYFNCDEIEKIYFELDEDNNIHWPSRQFLGEIMANFDYPEEKVLSGFTLAYLEDLGYFQIDKKYTGGLFKFGKNKGCKFFFGDCGRNLDNDLDDQENSVNNEIVFANEFYLPTTYSTNPEPSCTSGRLSKTIYYLHEITEGDEGKDYEYQINNYIGRKEVNYCPIAEFKNDISINLYTGSCSDDTTPIDISYHEDLGENSFCILSSIINGNDYKAVCHKMICSLQSLTIKIGDYYIVCPRSGGRIKPDKFNGYILCPDYNLICSGKELCNNIFDCIKKDSEEKGNTFDYTDYNIKTTQNSSLYKVDPVITDYPGELEQDATCPYLCLQCDLNYKCIKCAPHYKIYDEEENKCHERVPNCLDYEDENTCSNCKSEYSLVKEYNNSLVCISDTIINQNYYFKPEGNTYYLRCNSIIRYCEKCSEERICTKCMNSYELIDDGEKCDNINLNIYYKDNSDNKYKSCSKYNLMPNCYECEYNGINEFNCLKCINEYVLVHEADNSISCKQESTLIGDTNYFKKDENNYYSCSNSLYHNVPNCLKCSNKDTCTECQSGLKLVNNGQRCILQSDVDNNIIYFNPTTQLYTPCSELISLCHKCNNESTCTDCGTDGSLDINYKCASKDQIQNNNYYLDEATNRYVSCSIINNCLTCSSNTICISCNPGYILNNDKKCDKINEDDDDGLSTGAIIGIVFGSLGFLLIVAGVIYYLINRMKKQNSYQGDINDVPEEKIESKNEQENDGINEPEKNQVKTTKRSIHNV